MRPDPDAVETVLTWKLPKTEHQLMSFLDFANYYREFIKGYADKVYPMQQLMRHKGKKFTWNNAAQKSFQRINFPERPTLEEMEMDKPVLPEIEHLRGKVTDEQLEAIKDVLERNEEVFSRHKADIGCCNFVEHEIELEESAVPHREEARRMTPHKSEACREEIETLLKYDMIEPSKSP